MQVEKTLDSERSIAYSAIVARANYVSLDRPDIAYAVKEQARGMSNPNVGARCRLKRLATYLNAMQGLHASLHGNAALTG